MFSIRIAGLCIEIVNRFEYLPHMCRDYIVSEGTPDFRVKVPRPVVEEEYERDHGTFARSYYEYICVYREIAKRLPEYHAFLLHAAVVSVDGKAYAFAAKSGTGKSTHIQLWQQHFGARAQVVNGDKPILRWLDGTLYACGTPWNGKEGFGAGILCPLQAMCFIERGDENHIRPALQEEIAPRLANQVLMPKDPQMLDLFVSDVNRMTETIPFYVLTCNMSEEAAVVAYEGMCPGK